MDAVPVAEQDPGGSISRSATALTMFNELDAESFTVLAVTGGHFRAAAKFVDQHHVHGDTRADRCINVRAS
ncbi:hypothetical protein ACFQU1_08590 [Chelatococcus sp. GCM10030263]|uniref:hypothetical protein n=1 Tax=Chelatococcus sp. GCM10030263 TaxID=3273387 RepID=UPI003611A7D7